MTEHTCWPEAQAAPCLDHMCLLQRGGAWRTFLSKLNQSVPTLNPLTDQVKDSDRGCSTMFRWKTGSWCSSGCSLTHETHSDFILDKMNHLLPIALLGSSFFRHVPGTKSVNSKTLTKLFSSPIKII